MHPYPDKMVFCGAFARKPRGHEMTRTAPKGADMARTAFLYGRLSTTEQLQGHGKKRQSIEATGFPALCNSRGWVAATRLFFDAGLSAYTVADFMTGPDNAGAANMSHGDLGEFFRLAAKGTIPRGSILVAESLDRIIRPDNVGLSLLLLGKFIMHGISIATLTGEFFDSLDPDFGQTITALCQMERAGNESKTKSIRLRARYADARANLDKKKLNTRYPAWLKLRADLSGFDTIRERVATVRTIYRLCRQGVSLERITHQLNKTVPPMGMKGKAWNESYVHRILTTRAVLGEFQPCVGTLKKGKAHERTPAGPPIPDYYPRVIEDDEYYTVQAVLSKRRTYTGPRSKGTATNLFTGIVFDAWDGSPMCIAKKGSDRPTKMMVSYRASTGADGSRYMAVQYGEVERVILRSLTELKPSDLSDDGTGDELAALTARLDEVKANLSVIGAALNKRASATLTASAVQLEDEQADLVDKITRAKSKAAGGAVESLRDTKAVIAMLDAATGAELAALRDRLKAKIGLLVESVHVYVFATGERRSRSRWPQKYAYVQVYLCNGKCFDCFLKQGEWSVWYSGRMAAMEFDLRTLKDYRAAVGPRFDEHREMMEAALLLKHEELKAEAVPC